MAQQSIYLMAPNFDYKDISGPIRLGSLIIDPLKPHRALTSIDKFVLDTKYPRVEETTHINRRDQWGDGYDLAFCARTYLKNMLLGELSAAISAKLQKDAMVELRSKSLVTKYFVVDPSEEEIESRIKNTKVEKVMNPWKSSRGFSPRYPVYMISGLKVAKNGSAYKKRAESKAAGAVEGRAIVEGAMSGEEMSTERHEWESSEDIVVAYKLLKIERKRKLVVVDEYQPKAAVLDLGSSSHEDQVGSDDEVAVSEVTIADLESLRL
ncbi:hypothetical protein ACHAQJ_000773 [Trichoderma viride]